MTLERARAKAAVLSAQSGGRPTYVVLIQHDGDKMTFQACQLGYIGDDDFTARGGLVVEEVTIRAEVLIL
jgi:hypothetical protein